MKDRPNSMSADSKSAEMIQVNHVNGSDSRPTAQQESLLEAATLEASSRMRSLFDLEKGESGRLVADSIPKEQRPLLEAMGVCDDCEMRVCHNSGSCVLEIRGQRVGLSEDIASILKVLPLQR